MEKLRELVLAKSRAYDLVQICQKLPKDSAIFSRITELYAEIFKLEPGVTNESTAEMWELAALRGIYEFSIDYIFRHWKIDCEFYSQVDLAQIKDRVLNIVRELSKFPDDGHIVALHKKWKINLLLVSIQISKVPVLAPPG